MNRDPKSQKGPYRDPVPKNRDPFHISASCQMCQSHEKPMNFQLTRDSPRACFHHKLHGPEHGHSERPDRTGVPENRDCHHFYQVESGSGLNIYLMIPLSSFRLYPSARLSLSETCVKYLCCHLFVWFLLTLKLLYNIRHPCIYKNGSLLNFLFVFAFVNMSLC